MNLTLNAVDRLLLPQILPQKENILTQLIARDIARKTEITEKEREIIDLKINMHGGLTWDKTKISGTEKDVEFSEPEIRMLQGQVTKLDDGKSISLAMLEICIKIRDVKVGDDEK